MHRCFNLNFLSKSKATYCLTLIPNYSAISTLKHRTQSSCYSTRSTELVGRGLLKKNNMPSNIEIKARLAEPDFVKKTSLELSESKKADILEQEDTFFNCEQGRLKLRVTKNQSEKPAQLIFYERPDTTGPKHSLYSITPIHDPEALKVTLSQAMGVKGTVKKTRTLVIVGQTRVHIDDVEGLGQFMELEVVMRPDQDQEEGVKIAEDLKKQLGIKESDLLSGAYMDLILKQTQNGHAS